MDDTRKFQVTVRVDAEAYLTDEQWEEVGDVLENNIGDIYLSSVEYEGYCDECGSYEEQTTDVSVAGVDVRSPEPQRPGVIGLPK